ncbi:MAG TPA: hypothetical protein VMC09_13550 [Anaerolineales bacterium]|nr:hypothetical protein [Anaerolineales bacterium]
MDRLSKILIGMVVLFFSIAACGLGRNSGSAPNATSASSNPPASAGGGSSSAGYGSVPVPTDTVDLKAGQVYKVGQAVKDPQTGAIFEVTGVSTNGSLPGLNAGETYLMVEITLGNAGTQTFSSSSLGSYLVRAKSDGKGYGEGHILALLAAQAIPSNAGMDVDVAPGAAFHGILPVVLSTTATGLTITFTPAGSAALGNPFTVDLGQ